MIKLQEQKYVRSLQSAFGLSINPSSLLFLSGARFYFLLYVVRIKREQNPNQLKAAAVLKHSFTELNIRHH